MLCQPLTDSLQDSSHNSSLRVQPSLTSRRNKSCSDEEKSRPNEACAHDDLFPGSDAAHDPKCICETSEQHHIKHDERRGTIDRNAQFHSLSSEEREHLRCIEYQAVRLLSYVVPIYIVTWQILGCITIGTWMAVHGRAAAAANSVTPWYVSQSSLETESKDLI